MRNGGSIMEKGKVVSINVNSRSVFRQVLDEIVKADDEDLITDCVILSRRRYREGEKEKDIDAENSSGKLTRYWFGEKNTMNCLGMITHMQFILSNYIEGVDILEPEEEWL